MSLALPLSLGKKLTSIRHIVFSDVANLVRFPSPSGLHPEGWVRTPAPAHLRPAQALPPEGGPQPGALEHQLQGGPRVAEPAPLHHQPHHDAPTADLGHQV